MLAASIIMHQIRWFIQWRSEPSAAAFKVASGGGCDGVHSMQIVEASLGLLEDESAYGKVLMVHVNGKLYEWTPPKGNLKQNTPGGAPGKALASLTSHPLSCHSICLKLLHVM